jgi:predicted amino acid racemase
VSAPRLEIHLDRISRNAEALVERLSPLGIAVCGVTKATLGSPKVARELLAAGASSLGESRIENIERLRQAGITAQIALIRSPMLSQVDRVVESADISLNSELDVIHRLSTAAHRQHKRHGVILMVELGDLREGIMPGDLHDAVRQVLAFPGIALRGIGTNLACQSGVIPDTSNMAELSALATSIEASFGISLGIISGGNSANLPWALAPRAEIGRINHLRLGESILLGREPVGRSVLDGLRPDTISIIGEVIESKQKPSVARGAIGQGAFGPVTERRVARGEARRVIVALGRQDVDTDGIVAPPGYEILGAGSDHLVLESVGEVPGIGSELRFELTYAALLRSMTSPFVAREYVRSDETLAPVIPAAVPPSSVEAASSQEPRQS